MLAVLLASSLGKTELQWLKTGSSKRCPVSNC